MANPEDAAVVVESLERLQGARARLRAAREPDEIVALVAVEARALADSDQAWAARVDGAPVVSLIGSPAEGGSATGSVPPPSTIAALLADAHPIARADGLVAAALEGSGGVEGIVIVRRTDGGAGPEPLFDAKLSHLANVAGLALEAARLRRRVETMTVLREALLASAAHDLRNPLNTFAMSAGLLRDDLERGPADTTRALSLVARMDRATHRMQLLIEDLIEASRIDARKIEVTLRDESAAQIVDEAAVAASKAVVRVATVVPEGVDAEARVMADRARTRQLLEKVFAFETKATGDAGKISLGVAREGAHVVFTARALAPDGLAANAPEEGRGGLALLIARGLAEAQRGTLRVECDKGLVVAVTLPAAG